MKKYFILFLFAFSSILVTQHVYADTTLTPDPVDYKLLAPIPGIDNPNKPGYTDIATYIPNLIKTVIGLATGLAVLLVIWGGFQYVLSASVGGKQSGQKTINNALLGLLFLSVSWILLYTLNPKLVNFSLSLDNVGSNVAIDTSLPTTDSGTVPGNTAPGSSAGKDWNNNDGATRNILTNAGININKANCSTVGQQDCTSVGGLNIAVLQGLQTLKTACNCDITVTGGTEYWMHGNRSTELSDNPTPHRPEGTVIDLSLNTSVTDWIRKNATKSTDYSRCVIGKENGEERYTYEGALYVNETIDGNVPHWHVCYQ